MCVIRALRRVAGWHWRFVIILLIPLVTGCQGITTTPAMNSAQRSPGEGQSTQMAGPDSHAITATQPTPTSTSTPAVLVGAGDISICGQDGDDLTASLLDDNPGIVFTVGDNTNEEGTEYEYRNCFGPSWGRFLDRLKPSPGNHDYATDQGSAYYQYFSSIPVEIGKGYYSYSLGSWHIIVLNSVIDVRAGSAQEQWLLADLIAHPSECALAYWHHPRWTSGTSGDNGRMIPFWELLYEYGVDVVVNGNEHLYERFSPMDPQGKQDRQRGIREFIAGTGGVSHYPFGDIHDNSEVRDNTTYGVLKFSLYPGRYEWEFIPIEGGTFRDHGMDTCH